MAGSVPSEKAPLLSQLASSTMFHRQATPLGRRDYRLIDALQQPHPHLDGLYESVEEALADAAGWLESMGPGAGDTSIGLEVSTPCGSWRTIRQPEVLLCHLPLPTALC